MLGWFKRKTHHKDYFIFTLFIFYMCNSEHNRTWNINNENWIEFWKLKTLEIFVRKLSKSSNITVITWRHRGNFALHRSPIFHCCAQAFGTWKASDCLAQWTFIFWEIYVWISLSDSIKNSLCLCWRVLYQKKVK